MRAGFLHAREGGVSIVSAVSLTAALGFAGFATDVGFVYLQSRRLQGAADLAALAAAQDPAQGAQLARDTVHANHWPQAEIVVAPGRYTPDRAMAPRERFAPGAANANAVRVELTDSAPLYFGRLFFPEGRMTIRRAATAAQTRMAAFQIGSRLLALRGGAANALLSALAGGEVSLSAMDYDALLSAEVDLLAYVEALRARLDLEAATYEETLAGRIGAPAALDAIAVSQSPIKA